MREVEVGAAAKGKAEGPAKLRPCSGCGQGARRYAYNNPICSLYRVVRGGAKQSRAVSPPGLTLDGCGAPRTLLHGGPGIRPPSSKKRGIRGVPGVSLRDTLAASRFNDPVSMILSLSKYIRVAIFEQFFIINEKGRRRDGSFPKFRL